MEKTKNRIVVEKMKGGDRRRVRDFASRKDAVEGFYSLCDFYGCNFGTPVFNRIDGVNTQVGMVAGGDGYKVRLTLYI
jgi:hypothetical protein